MSSRAFSVGYGVVEVFVFAGFLASLTLGLESTRGFWTGLVCFRTLWLATVWGGAPAKGVKGWLERILATLIYQLPFWLTALSVPLSPIQGELASSALVFQVVGVFLLAVLGAGAPWGNWTLLLLFWALGVFMLDRSVRGLEWLWLAPPISLVLVGAPVPSFPKPSLKELWRLGGLIAVAWASVVCTTAIGQAWERLSEIVLLPWLCVWSVSSFLVQGRQFDLSVRSDRFWDAFPRGRGGWGIFLMQAQRVRSVAFFSLGYLYWTFWDLSSLAVGALFLLAAVRVAMVASGSHLDRIVERAGWLLVADFILFTVLWLLAQRGGEAGSLVAVVLLSAMGTFMCRGAVSDGVEVRGGSSGLDYSELEPTLRRDLATRAPAGLVARIKDWNSPEVEITGDLQAKAPTGFKARLLDRIRSSSESHPTVGIDDGSESD